MCGISGFIIDQSLEFRRAAILRMVECMKHRGPDDEGIFLNETIALGHVRLSIIDLTDGGHQPMTSNDNDLIIIFNGEIYNFKELRNELEVLGYSFNSHSDTEVILKGFMQWGETLFRKLNGIFAFAIWQDSSSTLWLVRDRFGVKPLYFSKANGRIEFSSEIKSILVLNNLTRKVSLQAFHEFLYYGNALGTNTLFDGIFKINPGYFLRYDHKNEQFSNTAYWLPENVLDTELPLTDPIREVRELTENAVKKQLVSDVPIGIFLSGGIDSSCITAFASRHYYGKLRTYTAAFDYNNGVNELEKARKVAKYFNTDHNELFIHTGHLPEVIESLVYYHDEPFSDAANIPLYLLTKQIKGSCKVILQGDGGDELFAGYRRYLLLDHIEKWSKLGIVFKQLYRFSVKNALLNRYIRMSNALTQKDNGKRMALLLTVEMEAAPLSIISQSLKHRLLDYDPFMEYKLLDKRFGSLDLVQRMLWTDTQEILSNTFLEKVDKSTMANSIEVRVPLLENDLSEYIMKLSSKYKIHNGQKKYILKKALRHIVPDEILDGKKTGFGVPYENWIKGPLFDMFYTFISSTYIKNQDIFNETTINKMMNEHKSGRINHGFLLWKILNASIWAEKYKMEFN